MTNGDTYPLIESTILNLPPDVKSEFKKIFFEFVASSTGNYDFKSLNEEVQIVENGTLTKFKTSFNAVKVAYESVNILRRGRIQISAIQNNFINHCNFTSCTKLK
jgi:hypothetical protein